MGAHSALNRDYTVLCSLKLSTVEVSTAGVQASTAGVQASTADVEASTACKTRQRTNGGTEKSETIQVTNPDPENAQKDPDFSREGA